MFLLRHIKKRPYKGNTYCEINQMYFRIAYFILMDFLFLMWNRIFHKMDMIHNLHFIFHNSILFLLLNFFIVQVVNSHDTAVYVLAPIKYASVYGCSDSIIVLGAVEKVRMF
jgi:hypothetical protein